MSLEKNGPLEPWQVLSSRTTYEDRWLKVRSDTCRTSTGMIVEPYHVFEYPDWVCVVALRRQDQRLVFLHEYRHGRAEIIPGLVSGGIEAVDKESTTHAAEAAARRELCEETGYVGGRFFHLLTTYTNPATHNNRLTAWLALDVEEGSEPPTGDGGAESLETVLYDLPQLLAEVRTGRLTLQAMHLAALWAAASMICWEGERLGLPGAFIQQMRTILVPHP